MIEKTTTNTATDTAKNATSTAHTADTTTTAMDTMTEVTEMTGAHFAQLKRSTVHAAEIAKGERQPARVTVLDPADVFPTVQFRHTHNLTHDQLATILGVGTDDIIDWEVGEATPTPPVQLLLALLFAHPKLVIDTANTLQHSIKSSQHDQRVQPVQRAQPSQCD